MAARWLAGLMAVAVAVDADASKPKQALLKKACPNYANYATYPHHPLSTGKLKLPFQRPSPECRTFRSDAIENVIHDVTSRMKDADLARLFENAFPSTTDTTIKFHSKEKDQGFVRMTGSRWAEDDDAWNGPQSFVITGDIIAEWLRDSTNQLRPYQELASKDSAIFELILGAINTQSEYVIEAPYCNAFQPPPISDLPVSANGQDDVVYPAYEPSAVFECKYELDSLAHFLKIGNDFYEHTGSSDFVNKRWLSAVDAVLSVLEEQSKPTFNDDGDYVRNEYTFQRKTNTGTETLNLLGVGNPLNNGTGLVRSAFRPSDDATILGFFIPANAMMSVELGRAAAMLNKIGKDAAGAELDKWSKTIREGVMEHGVIEHKTFGKIFAYEVDGFGSSIIMDDANYPSLLALPLMGFVDVKDPIYQNTRKMLLSKKGNPYYLTGKKFKGIGGPHIGLKNAWPMSLLVQAQTSDDDDEIMACVNMVLAASPKGLVHESVDVNYIAQYTRSWFAWANGVFAVTILDLAKRKPHLIFGSGAAPYHIGAAGGKA
ncbi:Meiotically up-regulated protein [Beauveria bassiana]|nr:Meiotically up-regulated protein [Beauveria bassiana]KAH8709533.1 Meiotically up-regulated 157 protein [Beauveria bassiana]